MGPHTVPAALVESSRTGISVGGEWTLFKKKMLMRYLPTDIHSSFIHNDQTWKYPRCPSIGERINKLCFIQTTEYYSGIKRKELSRHKKTCRNLKCILLSERSQSEKVT